MNPELSGVFIAPAVQIGKMTLRPFSAGTLSLIRNLGLTALGAEPGPLSEWSKDRQLLAFCFIQSQPLEDVKRAVKLARADLAAFEDLFLDFELTVELADMVKVAEQLESDLLVIGASQIDIEPKPARPGERVETPPKN